MNTSPSLSPPGSDLDGLVAELRAHVRYRYMPDACRQAMDRAATAIRTLRKGSESAGLYTEAHERLDDMARESIARAEAAEYRSSQLEAELKRRDEDARRMDWLERHTVNVRIPLVHGSADLFWATPDDSDEGEDGPSDLRAKIDASLQPQEGGDA